jgi:hypothetical protein
MSTTTESGTCAIRFDDDSEKARDFYEINTFQGTIQRGIGKDTIVISKKDCAVLESENIIYHNYSNYCLKLK